MSFCVKFSTCFTIIVALFLNSCFGEERNRWVSKNDANITAYGLYWMINNSGKGYDVNFRMDLTHWDCRESERITLLGSANNLVMNQNFGLALCKFIKKKNTKFISELEAWKKKKKRRIAQNWLVEFSK